MGAMAVMTVMAMMAMMCTIPIFDSHITKNLFPMFKIKCCFAGNTRY